MCCEFSDVGRRAGSPRAFGFCEKQTTQWSMHAHTHTAQSDTVRALSSHAHKIESLYPAARGLYRRNARTTIINQPLSACDILKVQSLSYHTNVPPHNIHRSLSLIHLASSSFRRPTLFFFFHPLSAPLPALFYLAPTSLIITHLLRRGAFLPYNSLRFKRGRRRGSAAPLAAPS